ncbi:MAG: CXXX repeat peptide modification system protein [Bacteroidetes bacterium]|nr:CXXX repeat peptide modification system protein [Bacteroidota bacterium]
MKKESKRTIVGKVTEEEKNEIKLLFERKNGLNELFRSLNDPGHPLYERIVKDMGETATRFQQWWNEKRDKYEWKSSKDGHWEINFNTCEISLVRSVSKS